MKTLKYLLLPALLLFSTGLRSQEFNCMVSVSSHKVEQSDKRVFETLQTALYEFMNNRKWSGYQVEMSERLDCSILVTIDQRVGTDEFRGSLNVVLRRPVFSSAYNTILLNHYDKAFYFRYVEYQPLDYADGTFSSNLTQVLAFYANMMLGYYFDSYGLYGGTQFFEKAQDIVNLAQGETEPGWKAYDDSKNRYWLVENILNGANAPLREFYYKYHRLGLDLMYEKVDAGRAVVTESLDLLNKVYQARPGLYLLQITMDAKKDELVNIYSDSRVPPMEKNNVVNILKEIDPSNGSKYLSILEGK